MADASSVLGNAFEQTTNVQNQNEQTASGFQIGNTAVGANAVGLSDSGGGSVSISQDSPEAIAALNAAEQNALTAVSNASSGALQQATNTAAQGVEAAKNATTPTGQTAAKFVVWLFGIAAAAAVVIIWLIFRRR